VAEILSPALHFSKPSNLFIYGKTGTGKTAVSKYVLNKLMSISAHRNINVRFSYVNCRLAGTEYRILFETSKQLDLQVPYTGLALSEVLSRLTSHLESERLALILILDEVDYIVRTFGDTLLYELTRINERLRGTFISLVGISNDLKFKEFLDARVLSSLSEEELVFPPYTPEELKQILLERVREGFHEGAVEEEAISLCAALAGAEHGDARRAVDLLRVAGEIAEREGSPFVKEEHIRRALQKIDQDRITEALRSLPFHAKLILLAIHLSRANASSGVVYQNYVNLCKQVGIEELTQRRVSSLMNELMMLGLVSSEVISFGRYGRTRRTQLAIPLKSVVEVFNEDHVVRGLLTTLGLARVL